MLVLEIEFGPKIAVAHFVQDPPNRVRRELNMKLSSDVLGQQCGRPAGKRVPEVSGVGIHGLTQGWRTLVGEDERSAAEKESGPYDGITWVWQSNGRAQ